MHRGSGVYSGSGSAGKDLDSFRSAFASWPGPSRRRPVALLPGLLAAVGITSLQVGLPCLRLLHVLRGLLLAAIRGFANGPRRGLRRFDRRPVFEYDSSLRGSPIVW